MKLNVEELRKEILEGARAVPLCWAGGGVKGVSEGRDAGKISECEREECEEGETSVTEVATEVSLESGLLGYLSHKL